MQWLLTVVGLLALLAGYVLEACDIAKLMWPSVAACGLLLFIANLAQLEEFTVGLQGLKGRTRKVIEDAESTIGQLRELALITAANEISLLYRHSRMGGVGFEAQERIVKRIQDNLRKFGLPEEKIQETLKDKHLVVEFDYARYCLGGIHLPQGLSPESREELSQMRGGGIDGSTPDPDEIEAFLKKEKLLTPLYQELIEDYRYYKKHREHRRPEVWAEVSKLVSKNQLKVQGKE